MFPRRSLVLLALVACPQSSLAADGSFTRTQDVVYGRKYGTALTMDVFRPGKPNGAGVVVIISGGRVGLGGCPPRPPTDPDVQNSSIRFLIS
jgi:hypothetical protein